MDHLDIILSIILLIGLSIQDYQTLRLNITAITLFAALNLWHAVSISQFVPHVIGAIIAFFLLGLLAYLTKYQLGMGDVCVIALLFLGLGAQLALYILLISASVVLLWAFIIGLIKNRRCHMINESNIPYLPFITLSYLTVECFEHISF